MFARSSAGFPGARVPAHRSRFTRFGMLVCAIACTAASDAALAAAHLTLTARTATNTIDYFGGFANVSDSGADGITLPANAFLPAALNVVGHDYAELHSIPLDGWVSIDWTQTQTYRLANVAGVATLVASGASHIVQDSLACGTAGCNLGTEIHHSTNIQGFEFTLDGPSAYALGGSTRGGQFINLDLFSTQTNRWTPVVVGRPNTENLSFALGGNLAAGLYRVTNRPVTINGGAAQDVDNAWNYTLTLAGAQVTNPVPEPAVWALWLAGAALLAGRRLCRG